MDGNMVMVGVGTTAERIAAEFQERRFHGLQVRRRMDRARAARPFFGSGGWLKRMRQ